MCIEIYGLDPAHYLSAPGLVWQACLKKTGVNLELLTDIDMLLMVEEGIRGGICHVIHRYAKANNKYKNNYDKSIESSYLMYLDASNLYELTMCQKLPVNGFKWVKKLSKFNKRFIKSYDENSDIGYFFEVDVEYPKKKKLGNLHKDLPFLPEIKTIGKSKKACLQYRRQRKICYSHKSLKISIKSWINTKKSAQSNSIESRSIIKIMH